MNANITNKIIFRILEISCESPEYWRNCHLLTKLNQKERKTLPQSIGENVKALRKHRGLTIAKLAELAGISPTTLGGIEAGQSKPPGTGIGTLRLVADALGVHLGTLIGIDDVAGRGAVTEVSAAEARARTSKLGVDLMHGVEAEHRFFAVTEGFSLHAIRMHPGDILIVDSKGEPTAPRAVVIHNTGLKESFEARLFLDPYLIGPDCEGILRHEMKQNPDITIIGEIAVRIGRLI